MTGEQTNGSGPAPDGAAVCSGKAIALHVSRVVERRLEQIAENWTFWSAGDPVEAVHDLRVASRRLRAFSDVFAPLMSDHLLRRTTRPLRKVTRAVRSLRDCDVTAGLLERRLESATLDAERAALEHLLVLAGEQRADEDRAARERLAGVDRIDLEAGVAAALGEVTRRLSTSAAPPSDLASRLLAPWTKNAAAQRPRDEVEDPEQMHELRITLKKLRYALELWEPALGESYGNLHGRITHLQEVLGDHHDRIVLAELVEARRSGLDAGRYRLLSAGFSSLASHLHTERRDLFQRFRLDPFDAEAWQADVERALAVASGH